MYIFLRYGLKFGGVGGVDTCTSGDMYAMVVFVAAQELIAKGDTSFFSFSLFLFFRLLAAL